MMIPLIVSWPSRFAASNLEKHVSARNDEHAGSASVPMASSKGEIIFLPVLFGSQYLDRRKLVPSLRGTAKLIS